MHAYIHTYIHTHIHTHTHIHKYTHTHIYTYTHIHTHTHTPIHIYIYNFVFNSQNPEASKQHIFLILQIWHHDIVQRVKGFKFTNPKQIEAAIGSWMMKTRLGGRPLSKLTCEREREMFYLTTHSTHFIYGYMASDLWLRTILIMRKETCCRHIGYSY